jgi:hypothetical protein
MNRFVSVSAIILVLVILVSASACSSNDSPGKTNVTVGGATGIAIVNSDYMSTSISLFDPAKAALTFDDCINSKTTATSLSLSLSGDVVLPSAAQPGHELLLIDRFNAALTWLEPTTCTVKRQFSVGTGFPSDPHDVVALSPTKAYVTRYEKNPKPTDDPADNDEGDDILIINPTDGTISGRIDLAPFAGKTAAPPAMPGADPGPDEITVSARPGRALLIDGNVYVALDNISADFSATADGRILVIDPAADTVSGMIDLPGLKNCGGLAFVPDSKTLVVTCTGDFNAAVQIDGSAIVAIDLSASPPATKSKLGASVFGGQPLSADAGGALSAGSGLAVSLGTLKKMPPDRLWSYDLEAGTATQLKEASDSFVYGALLLDSAGKQLFLTDGAKDTPRVHVFDVSGAPTLKTSVDANPAHGLPPRSLGWY